MGMTEIVILGAGAGGAMTANLLRRKLGSEVSVTLVDKSVEHFYQPSFYLIPFGYLEPEQSRDVRDLVHSDVEFVHDAVTGVDVDEQVVHLDESEEAPAYDYLVVATGHRLAPETTPGMAEAWEETDSVYPFYHYEAALGMREGLENFDGSLYGIREVDFPLLEGVGFNVVLSEIEN